MVLEQIIYCIPFFLPFSSFISVSVVIVIIIFGGKGDEDGHDFKKNISRSISRTCELQVIS